MLISVSLQEKIKSLDGTRISLCVATVDKVLFGSSTMKTIYILYFQGYPHTVPCFHPFAYKCR